jgi:hypothetical protein
MPVPKFVSEATHARDFASTMDRDLLWDTGRSLKGATFNSVTLEKEDLGTH